MEDREEAEIVEPKCLPRQNKELMFQLCLYYLMAVVLSGCQTSCQIASRLSFTFLGKSEHRKSFFSVSLEK
jgi:hypothetical protein